VEQIDALLASLEAQGMRVDIEQRVRLNGLLQKLAGEQLLPDDPTRLCRLITPILAGSPEQQLMCEAAFKSMFGPDEQQQDTNPDHVDSAKSRHEDRQRGWAWPDWLAWGLIVGMASLIVAAVYISVPGEFLWHRTKPGEFPKGNPTKTLPRGELDWIKNYPVEELDPPQQAAWNRSLRWYYTEYDTAKWTAVLLPLAMYLGFLAFLYHRLLAYLRRDALREKLRSLDWRLSAVNGVFGDRRLIGDLQPLRKYASSYLRVFDPKRTAIASAESGGLLRPRFKEIALPTDFIVLIDRQSPRDHLATYNMEIVRTLRNAGLSIELFEFNGDPSLCHSGRTGAFLPLPAVVRHFPGSVILIFAAADQLMDQARHRQLPTVASLKEAWRAVLVTPESAGPESPLERALAQRLGIAILRSTPAGVGQLVRLLLQVEGGGAKRHSSLASEVNAAALVDFFADRPGRWMQSVPPRASERHELQKILSSALQPPTLRWLAASAVYPELRWPLTLSLKSASNDSGRARRALDSELLAVSRLPWFRNGWMPDWIRNLLQHSLAETEKKRVRRMILDMIGRAGWRAKDSGEEVQINFIGNELPRKERVKTDRITLNYLLSALGTSSPPFTVPESWVRRLIRKPLLRLGGIAAVAMVAAAAISVGALSLLPIDECDLFGASLNDELRIGPGNISVIYAYQPLRERARVACEDAVKRMPTNGRYWYQLSRAASSPMEGYKAAVRAAELGYPSGYYSLGYIFYTGKVVKIDVKKAEMYYEKAVRLGNAIGLDGLYDIASDRGDHQAAFIYINEYYMNGGYNVAPLAIYYADDSSGVVKKNLEKYREILEEAVRRGSGYAAFNLAYYLESQPASEIAQKNLSQAITYYELSFKREAEATAASNLARIYMRGRGVTPDMAMATRWAIIGIKLGSGDALDTLIDLMSSGEAVFKGGYEPSDSFDKGKLFQLGAENGDAEKQYQYARYLEQHGQLSEAVSWYSKAATNDNSDAVDALSRLNKKTTKEKGTKEKRR
jgi:TPR repeat protein